MKKVNSFEHACELTGRDPKKLPDVSMLEPVFQKHLLADYMLMVIIEAATEGWKPDWANGDEFKYRVWFWWDPEKSAFVFGGAVDDWTDANSYVGSRFVFPDSKTAEYVATKFIDLYRDIL